MPEIRSTNQLILDRLDRLVIPVNEEGEQLFSETNPGIMGGAEGMLDVNIVNTATAVGEILRNSVTNSVTFLAGAFQTDPFDMQSYSGGNVYIPAAWTNADIGFKVAPTIGGTYMILYDDNGNIAQSTVGAVVSHCYAFPPEVYACRFVRLWSQLAGVNVLQVAQRNMVYELKS